jgi:transcriptional regulator with XRE-family HTH domain
VAIEKLRRSFVRRLILMSRASRQKPVHLAKKLRKIRDALGLSQNGIIAKLGLTDEITQDYVSAYERGVREPPLPVLLGYARAAGVCVDVLIDDHQKLPTRLPGVAKHRGRP